MQLNGFADESRYHYLQADVLSWLAEPFSEQFNLAIIDPPSFSNSKRMDGFLDIQRDHAWLINETMGKMHPQGIVYFSTNLSSFQLESSQLRVSEIKDITKASCPFDFEGKLRRFCFRFVK